MTAAGVAAAANPLRLTDAFAKPRPPQPCHPFARGTSVSDFHAPLISFGVDVADLPPTALAVARHARRGQADPVHQPVKVRKDHGVGPPAGLAVAARRVPRSDGGTR